MPKFIAPGKPPKVAGVDDAGAFAGFGWADCCFDKAAPGSNEAPKTPTEGFDTGCCCCCCGVGNLGFVSIMLGCLFVIGDGVGGIVGFDKKELAISV